jgi:hypothetical protein
LRPSQQSIDLVLRDGEPSAALADIEFFGLRGDGDDLGRHQRVVDEGIGLRQRAQHVEGEQAWIAGAGARQPDMAVFQHARLEVEAGQRFGKGGFWRVGAHAPSRPRKRR